MKSTIRISINIVAATVIAVGGAGCKSIGPGQVAGDRSDYSAAIGDSWKRQTLLNIVKLRYLDPPIFVDVGQIIASRSFSGTVSVGGTLQNPNPNTLSLGAAGTYTDQPTVTYTPLTGNKFVKSLMTPLPPESVFFMIHSGWAADDVLYASLSSINGLKNQSASAHGAAPPSPEFLKVLSLMRAIQLSGGVALRVDQDADKRFNYLLVLQHPDITSETKSHSQELRRLLRLDPETAAFKLVLGASSSSDKEVAVLTRSILQLMAIMASEVEVPAQHVANHSAAPGRESLPATEQGPRLIRIQSTKDRPPHPFVAVQYRDHWFWIDDHDLASKRTFAYMMLLFTLADSSDNQPPPVVTIPAR